MNLPIAGNPVAPFLKQTIWYYSLLALSFAITANISQIWLLEQEPNLLGSLPFSLGQCFFIRELQRQRGQYRRPRLIIAACLMIGGITLLFIQHQN
jgi:hypothetical protein